MDENDLVEFDDDSADPAIAQDDVISAARSCSAILIIGVIVVLIVCLAFALTIAF